MLENNTQNEKFLLKSIFVVGNRLPHFTLFLAHSATNLHGAEIDHPKRTLPDLRF